MKTILFQGDSITDCNRNREVSTSLGTGYATLVSSHLGYEYPAEYLFCNRGISGNRIVDLYARIKIDAILVRPDYMSILIGINDVWHEYTRQNGVNAEKFYRVYHWYVQELLEALPELKLMILEPFVLPGSNTENNEEHPARFDFFRKETLLRAEAARKVADDFSLPFIPLQNLFDRAAEKAPCSFWLRDGVHPTPAGHQLIQKEWLKSFDQIR